MTMANETKPEGSATWSAQSETATAEILLRRAEAAGGRAYAPYSGFHIGASLLTAAGNVYDGCNVENASYGLTSCAERNAVVTAVAAEGGSQMQIVVIAIWTNDLSVCPPCGACRQVIAEFGRDAHVIYQSRDGLARRSVAELLPDYFSAP